MSHKREASWTGQSPRGSSSDTHHVTNVLGGVGKGVAKLLSISSSPVRSKRAVSESDYLRPGTSSYPKYEENYAASTFEDIPVLLTVSLYTAIPTKIEYGTDDGFFECLGELEERKSFLKNILKQLEKNPNYLEESNSQLNKVELKLENFKRKLFELRKFERAIKQHQDTLQKQRLEKAAIKDDRFFGVVSDTYPFNPVKNEKDGLPNADSFAVDGYSRMIQFALADGIGWGIASRRASQAAVFAFLMKVRKTSQKKQNRNKLWDTTVLGHLCTKAVEYCHQCVFAFTEAKTTLAAGIMVELVHQSQNEHNNQITIKTTATRSYQTDSDDEEDAETILRAPVSPSSRKRWVFVGMSVGDSLLFRYSTSRMQVTELTTTNRSNGVRDAGGSLGGVEADLRNLTIHSCQLEEGDLILAMSDGVHDNLDPEVLGLTPEQTGLSDYKDWSDIKHDWLINDLKRQYKEQKLTEIIREIQTESPSDPLNPEQIVNAIDLFVQDATREHREAFTKGATLQRDWDKMESDERDQLNEWVQTTMKAARGKFDHSTCVCIRAGQPTTL